ncbi:hypothetical protein [Oceanimonas baumannii]|uniref:hypothetical protein n=1 Tax=Oceanimonas baumannii TaxID=129578 RepID=UPI003A90AF99
MNTVNITSYGNGDAFGGNKIVNADILIENIQVKINDNVSLGVLRQPMGEALENFRQGNKAAGLQTLNIMRKMEPLSDEAKLAIASLRILMCDELLTEDEVVVERYSAFSDYSDFAKEIANAATLKLIEARKGQDAARDYFHARPVQMLSLFIYLQRLATQEYVQELSEQRSNLSDFILGALFEKVLEFDMIEEGGKVLEQLKLNKPLETFERETTILACVNSSDLTDKDYFFLSSVEKAKLDDLRDSLISLVEFRGVVDFKILNILTQLFRYTQYTCRIIARCLEGRNAILEEQDFFGNKVLRSVLTNTPLKEVVELKSLTPKQLSEVLIGQTQENYCNLPACRLLNEYGDSELIVATLNQLADKESINEKVTLIALAAISKPILTEEEFPNLVIEDIIDKDLSRVELSVSFIHAIAEELACNGHVLLAVKLYKIAFGDYSPWLSEQYLSYLNYLHQSRQYYTVSLLLARLSEEEKQCEEVVVLYSLLANKDENYEQAEKLLRLNIDKYQGRELERHEKRNLVYLWGQYLETVFQRSPDQAYEITHELPPVVFDEYFGEISWRLIFYHSCRIADVAEKMLDWFFDDPHTNAKHYFQIMMHSSQNFPEQEWPEQSGKYLAGFHYKESGRSHIKVAVPTKFTKNSPQYLIDNLGKVAAKLGSSEVGEPILLQVKVCTLVEKLYPIMAACRISQVIMDDDENEVFHMLSLPEDASGEEILEAIENLMRNIREQRSNLKPMMRQSTSIDIKYKLLNGIDNVEKALQAVLNDDVRIDITSDTEESVVTGCKHFVIDEMTAVYLACIGKPLFSDHLWHMTENVHASLSQFCDRYNDKFPSYHSSHDTVYFNENRDESAISTDVIANLTTLLEKTEVHSDANLDIPIDIKLKLRSLCTQNFLLSISLAEKLQAGFFSIDAGTRLLLRMLNLGLVALKPDNFIAQIVTNKDPDVIANLLWLNQHQSISSISFDSICHLIQEGSEENLYQLMTFVKSRGSLDWELPNLINLAMCCLDRFLFQNKIDVIEKILYELLCVLLSDDATSDEIVDAIITLLPIPLFINAFSKSELYSKIKVISKLLEEATELYLSCISKALKENGISSADFWSAFEKRCELTEH